MQPEAKGVYTFSTFSFGRLFLHQATVTIVGHSDKTYTIICPCAIGSHRPGDKMRVRKKSVRLLSSPSAAQGDTNAAHQHDYSAAWWNN